MSGLNAAGFLGSSGLCAIERIAAVKDKIISKTYWTVKKYHPICFTMVIFELDNKQYNIFLTSIDVLQDLCVKRCTIKFVDEVSKIEINGCNVFKSNILSNSSNKPLEYAYEDFNLCSSMPLFDKIPLPKFPFVSCCKHEMRFISKVNASILKGYFRRYRDSLDYTSTPICCLPLNTGEKADIVLYTVSTGYGGSSVLNTYFISHKAGPNGPEFRQWSGISKNSGERIYNNKLVKNISHIIDVNEYLNTPTKRTIRRIYDGTPESVELMNCAMYGHDYTEFGESGPNNVDMICFGEPDEKTTQSYFEDNNPFMRLDRLIHRDILTVRPDLEPCFSLRPASDRNVDIHGLVIPNTRIGISPLTTFG